MRDPMRAERRRSSSRIKKSRFDIVSNIIVFFFAIVSLFPLYWMFSNALKDSISITSMPPEWIPLRPSLTNYVQLFASKNIVMWGVNSLIIAAISTTLVVLVSSLSAYSFSKLRFYGRQVIFVIFISTLMIPKDVYIVPLFKVMQAFHLINTRVGALLPNVALPFGVFLLKQFLDTIPDDLRESAKMDGCSEFRVYLRIVMPMAKAGLGALTILQFVSTWNDYLWQLVMLSKDSLRTLQIGIASMQTETMPNLAFKTAGASLAAIPMLVVFILFQRAFTKGITLGALKE
jgi:multiple sugar transport system permease protein